MDSTRKMWKYERDMMSGQGTMHIKVPRYSRIRSIQVLDKKAVVYIEHPHAYDGVPETVTKTLLFVETGAIFPLPVNHTFLGTLVFMNGEYVLHAYDVSTD